ncbi:MAG: hypothetical protein IJY94_02045 [Clostridia bacterium]|nr:hypothetical protein [Clostridia bacterium]
MSKIYDLFKEAAKSSTVPTTFEKMNLVRFSDGDKNYEVYFTAKRANKRTIINCVDNYIEWEQLPMLAMGLGGAVHGIKKERILSATPSKEYVRIVVIMGKPTVITGLDDGIFRSANRFDESFVNVMSESRFKTLEGKI